MIKLLIALLALACSGCTVVQAGSFHMSLLCNRDIVQRDGMSMHLNDPEGMRHLHCDKKEPLHFTYTFGVK